MALPPPPPLRRIYRPPHDEQWYDSEPEHSVYRWKAQPPVIVDPSQQVGSAAHTAAQQVEQSYGGGLADGGGLASGGAASGVATSATSPALSGFVRGVGVTVLRAGSGAWSQYSL